MIRVNDRSPLPVFEQVRQQLEALIVGGHLAPQQQLPTVRQLASDLGVAPGTIVRAYKELEAANLITTRGRAGTRVADHLEDRPGILDAALEYADAAQRAGVTLDQAILALRASWASDE